MKRISNVLLAITGVCLIGYGYAVNDQAAKRAAPSGRRHLHDRRLHRARSDIS